MMFIKHITLLKTKNPRPHKGRESKLRGTTLIIPKISGYLFQVRPTEADYTLDFANGALSGRPSYHFGLQLPSPFSFCAGTGSHLLRLSELRWKPTILVHSLLIYNYAKIIG